MKNILATALLLLLTLTAGCRTSNHKQTSVITFHHCSQVGYSGNSPHLFDTSETYQCDEGAVKIAGQIKTVIENGYVYETELGRSSLIRPHLPTPDDYKYNKWCASPKPWDPNEKEVCGNKPTTCFDGKPGTWDPEWRGYSCATPDHRSRLTPK